LIVYHGKWDQSLSSMSFLTDQAFVELLPSYLCACVLWNGVEAEALARSLLAPLATGETETLHRPRFEFVQSALSNRNRSVLGSFLLYLLEEPDGFEFTFDLDKQSIAAAIKKYWGEGRLIKGS
jgi:hypothetical protein